MPRDAEMRVRKTDDTGIVILIPSAIFIRVLIVNAVDIVRLLIGVGGKLDRTKRNRCARKCVAHLLRADERVHVTNVIRCSLSSTEAVEQPCSQQDREYSF